MPEDFRVDDNDDEGDDAREGFLQKHPVWSLVLSPVILAITVAFLLGELVLYAWTGKKLWSEPGTIGNRLFGDGSDRPEDDSMTDEEAPRDKDIYVTPITVYAAKFERVEGGWVMTPGEKLGGGGEPVKQTILPLEQFKVDEGFPSALPNLYCTDYLDAMITRKAQEPDDDEEADEA